MTKSTHLSAFRSVLACLAIAATTAGCGGGGGGSDSGPPPADDFDRRSLLGSYADRVVLPALRAAAAEASALADASADLEAAVALGGDAAAEHAAARQAWRAAMDAWQAVEVLQVGPAGRPGVVMGGQGLRDEIYSWPVVNPCRVDQETVRADFLEPSFFEQQLVNVRGLDAIEYLLFAPDADNACSANVDINADGTWQALVTAGELAARRAAYAARAAADVADRATELRDLWEPASGNFAGALATAGAGSSTFSTAQSAIDDVFAALFFIELDFKDLKLRVPAGLSPDCPTDVCPELVESPWADASKEHLLANLVAAKHAFLGGATAAQGVGFDDFLVARGAGALAATMTAALDASIASVEAIPGSLSEALLTDPDSVRAAEAAVKTFTDPLKSQFVTILNLTIPQEGAGDND